MTITMTGKAAASSVLLMLLSTACNRADEPTDADYDDVGVAVGSLVAGNGEGSGEAGSVEDTTAIALGELPADLTASGTGTITGVRGSLTYSYSIACSDVDGNSLEVCGATTDEANVMVDWTGTLDTATYDATLVRSGDWTLANIQSGTAEFNGQGTFDVDSEFLSLDGNRMRTFELAYAADYQQILVDTNTLVISGGQAQYVIHARRTASNQYRDVEAEFDMEALLTFNGDGTATLVLDATRSYAIDLASGAVTGL